MRAELYRPGQPEDVVGFAVWSDHVLHLSADDEAVRESLQRIFRRTQVAVDDPSLRSFGTSGPVLLAPGTLRWFRAAAESRAAAEGLAVRLVPEGRDAMGWDPAGAYRSFVAAIERKERLGSPAGSAPVQAGESRPVGERGPSAPGTEAASPTPGPSAASPSES